MAPSHDALTVLRERAAAQPRPILLPESQDSRIAAAANQLRDQQLCIPVFLTPCQDSPDTQNFETDPERDQWLDRARAHYLSAMRHKQPAVTADDAQHQLDENPLLLAAVLVAVGYADGGIAGSIATTADVLRAGLRGIGLGTGSRLVSSIFLMLHGERVLSFADCAVNPEPDAEGLAQIAIDSASTHEKLTGETPTVALLAFSTLGSAEHATIDTVRQGLQIARDRAPGLAIEGEFQFDTAFDSSVAARKAPSSNVAGATNVFVFPNLHAANIGYKIAERMGGARAIGPILQGLAKPWQDLSRGCDTQDIVDLAVITAALAD